MTDDRTPIEPTPIEADELDELLSAELDGELDAVARERGLSTRRAERTPARHTGAPDRVEMRSPPRATSSRTPPRSTSSSRPRLRAKAVRAAEADGADPRSARARPALPRLAAVAGVAAVGVGVVALAAEPERPAECVEIGRVATAAAGERARAGAPSSSAEHAPALADGPADPAADCAGNVLGQAGARAAAVGRAAAVNAPATGQSAHAGLG